MSPKVSILLSLITLVYAINRPVFKIILSQKGYAQFLQYDVETPPLREFTFCAWIRVFDLKNDQSIFTYVVNGNRLVRLWLVSSGQYMSISIDGLNANVPVNIVKDVWRHVCLSFQTDFGAWAIYIDSRLVSCQTAQSIRGFVLPGGGSIIIGYGTSESGTSIGFEGEIFGANMILSSTIERNYTMKSYHDYEQKSFPQNKLKERIQDTNYIVLRDLITDEIHNNFEKTVIPPVENSTQNFIKFQTPHRFVQHNVGVKSSNKILFDLPNDDSSNEQEVFDFTSLDLKENGKEKNDFFSKNQDFSDKKANAKQLQSKLLYSNTEIVPNVSEYETPPPPPYSPYFDSITDVVTESINNKKSSTLVKDKETLNKKNYDGLVDFETPPPKQQQNQVYGQWTSSNFAGSVLQYIKNMNLKTKELSFRKVPFTIPLYKISDSYPYSSEFKTSKLRVASEFKRKNIVEKRHDSHKRYPQINVQILENDLRSQIIKTHAETRAKRVMVTNRGQTKTKLGRQEYRFYRNAVYQHIPHNQTRPVEEIFESKDIENIHKLLEPLQNVVNESDFFKSPRYFMHQNKRKEMHKNAVNKDMYSKSLSTPNKWHNVKTYSNDYTPRKLDIDSTENNINGKLHPAIKLGYVPKKKIHLLKDDPFILNGRKLAREVSNQASPGVNHESAFQYNHGHLINYLNNEVQKNRKRFPQAYFDEKIKIGNTLNERTLLGDDDVQKKQSFEGGNDNIPDINRYRSDIDNVNGRVPASLRHKVCLNAELYDRILYVQPDETINISNILSPIEQKNVAINFIIQNYKKCSLADSPFQGNALLFIDWSQTPVRLFGGAYPKTTTDLCGFF